MGDTKVINLEHRIFYSDLLQRQVTLDLYFPEAPGTNGAYPLLLINDGQDLVKFNFEGILSGLLIQNKLAPLFCVGIYCGPERIEEYGTSGVLDFKGRGKKASRYQEFITGELTRYLEESFPGIRFSSRSCCGFSMGGLSALDTVWNFPDRFARVGIFSGALWWRKVDQDDPDFVESRDRIVQAKISGGVFHPGLKFFFETGTLDETADRNHNGVIDSIDDTLAIIDELARIGYQRDQDIRYLELNDGRHDLATWARTFPEFLQWGWGIQEERG